MLTVRNLLMYDPDTNLARLGDSVLGDFCLNSLRSSVRELRIAAGYVGLRCQYLYIYYFPVALIPNRQTLPVFLRESLDPDLRRSNFVFALEYLQTVREKSELATQETCAMALRHIAEYVFPLSCGS